MPLQNQSAFRMATHAGRRIAAAIVVSSVMAAAGLGLAACDKEKSKTNSSVPWFEPSDTAGTPARPPLCSASSVRCGSVWTSAGAEVEYAIVAASRSAAAGLVLVELGGPGIDFFARSDTASLDLPPSVLSNDLLVVREPWASEASHPQCDDALKGFGEALSREQFGPPIFTAGKCSSSSWGAAGYTHAVSRILEVEKRALTGIIGQSYGALPAAQAASANPKAWLVLHAPIAPARNGASVVMLGRASALGNALDVSYEKTCQPLRLDCGKRGSRIAGDAIRKMTDRQVVNRGQPLRRGDLALAVMAAAYDLQANERWLWPVLTSAPHLNDQDWASVGRLADQLIQRYGEGSVSPRLGAYISGVCQSYTGWDSEIRLPLPELSLLLRAVIAQCHAQPSLKKSGWSAKPIEGATCVIINDHDTVVDIKGAQAWSTVFPAATFDHYRYAGHLSLGRAVQLQPPAFSCTSIKS